MGCCGRKRKKIDVRDALKALCGRLRCISGSSAFDVSSVKADHTNRGDHGKKFLHYRLPNGVSFYLGRSISRVYGRIYSRVSKGVLSIAVRGYRLCQFAVPPLWRDKKYADDPKVVAVRHSSFGSGVRFFVFPPDFFVGMERKSIVLVNSSGDVRFKEFFENFDLLLNAGQQMAVNGSYCDYGEYHSEFKENHSPQM